MFDPGKLFIAIVGLAVLVGCGEQATEADDPMAATDETAAPAEQAPVAAVDQQRLDTAAEQPEQWLTYGGS